MREGAAAANGKIVRLPAEGSEEVMAGRVPADGGRCLGRDTVVVGIPMRSEGKSKDRRRDRKKARQYEH